MTGTVHLVGAGPGAADLLTLRAARLLAEADVVLHDALVSPEVLALATRARLIPVGKRAGRPSAEQAFICRLMIRAARTGRCVVRLKGGDPFLFGRAEEEIAACRAAGIAVEVVPGVSAGFAAAAALCAPLTRRGLVRSVVFLTPAAAKGSGPDERWADAAAGADTLVIYMGKRDGSRVLAALLARGLSPAAPLVLAEAVSWSGETLSGGALADLPALADAAGDGPALLLIGEVFAEAAAAHAPAAAGVRRA
jgi:uroporphyrin-III C-methyltransferase